MSALTFTLKYKPAQRVDLSPLVCNQLAGLSLADIGAILLQVASLNCGLMNYLLLKVLILKTSLSITVRIISTLLVKN